MGLSFTELFPTKYTFFIFILYMSLFVGQGIFVTASQDSNNSYSYNIVSVVLFTEFLKLVLSVCLYFRQKNIFSLILDVYRDWPVMMLYFVPAFLYCLYNNLTFTNLTTFDPTSYYLLLQLRVVFTGILFQIIFKKYLTVKQWLSLILLTIGCMIKQLNFNSFFNDGHNQHDIISTLPKLMPNNLSQITNPTKQNDVSIDVTVTDLNFRSSFLIFAQIICSCIAGVYNEYLLKDRGSEVNIFIQNIYMYINSIICNMVVLVIKGELNTAFQSDNLQSIVCWKVIIIIINNAAIGLVTSFFLKYMNSILKTFASALELVFTAILSYFLFSIPIYINTALAICVVSFSIYLYSQSPVVNTGRVRPPINIRSTNSDLSVSFTSDNRKIIVSDKNIV